VSHNRSQFFHLPSTFRSFNVGELAKLGYFCTSWSYSAVVALDLHVDVFLTVCLSPCLRAWMPHLLHGDAQVDQHARQQLVRGGHGRRGGVVARRRHLQNMSLGISIGSLKFIRDFNRVLENH
jgi:hypothetical protein